MPDERVIQQVSGILSMNDVSFNTDDSQTRFLVLSGSTGVVITFGDMGELTLVSLRSILLEQVDGDGDRRLAILEALNEKNSTAPFGCFYYQPDPGTVVFDYQLL